jgi:HSP90 family molecular chaperone
MKDFIVEINPSNDLIVNLNETRKQNPKLASLALKQLYETGLMQSGIPFNNKDMIQRNYKILKRLFEAESRAPLPEEVKTERLSQE